MTLAEKLRYLREVEGSLRGLGRPMTQQELVRAIRKEQGKTISQSYVSQIEGGARRHMTQSTRTLLAKFFKVHPGFLVDDPEGYHTELVSDLRTTEGKLDVWLLQGSERFASDPQVSEVSDQGGARKRYAAMLPPAGGDPRYSRAGRSTAGSAASRAQRNPDAQQGRKATAMTWADFYLICFAVGFFFSLLSFLRRRSALASCTCRTFRMCTRHRLMPVRDMARFRSARSGEPSGAGNAVTHHPTDPHFAVQLRQP